MKSYQNDVEKSRPITENESSKRDSNDAFVVTNDYVLRVAFYSFLGFTILEATFAIRAKSTAMIADSVAMLVDVGTYLFNLLAELLKDRELTDHELQLSPIVQYHRRKLQRLYLELIPPMTSVCTLLVVTVFTIRCSIKTLSGLEPVDSDGPNLYVMMFFSVLNLLIDCINVSCFARINQTILCPKKFEEMPTYDQPMKETSLLLTDQTTASCTIENTSIVDDSILGDDDLSYEDDEKSVEGRNLNMCSAWTVSS
jgi:Co/Zn/Cd efflux system component